MARTRAVVIIVAAWLELTGCQNVADGAKERFSKDNSCPIDRVESRVREDLKPSSFYDKTKAAPPADIAADPTRLAMWHEKQDAAATQSDSFFTIAEARGCGKQALYQCSRSKKHAQIVDCIAQTDVPSTIVHW